MSAKDAKKGGQQQEPEQDLNLVPPAVRKQQEEARKRFEEQRKTGEPKEPEEPAQDPDKAPKSEKQTVEQKKDPEKPAAEPGKKPDADDETWQQKYRVLRSKYDAEVPRLHEANRNLMDQMAELKQQVEELKAGMTEGGEAEEGSFSAETLTGYDEALVEMGKTVELLQRELKAVRAENKELKGDVTSVKKTEVSRAKQDYYTQLNSLPGIAEQNKDQEFEDWLDEVDALSGSTRRDIMIRHDKNRNAAGVHAVFNQFRKETGRTYGDDTGKGKQVEDAEREQERTPVQPDVEEQIAPTGEGAGGPSKEQKATYVKEDVSQFYVAYSKREFPFTFKGRQVPDEEAAELIRRDILAAGQEGRLKG